MAYFNLSISVDSIDDVIIRTNSAYSTFTVDDASEKGKIKHYDTLGKLLIEDCAMESYYEEGKVSYAKIDEGHVVVDGTITMAYTTASSSDKVVVEGNVTHAHASSSGNAEALNGAPNSVDWDYDGEEGTTHEANTSSGYDPEVDGSNVAGEDASSEKTPEIENIDGGIVYNLNQQKYYSEKSGTSTDSVVYSESKAKALRDAVAGANYGDALFLFESVEFTDKLTSSSDAALVISKSITINGQ